MAQPGDGVAGCDHLRASHADRERVIGMLETAFAAGLLSKDARDLGVDRALAARTYAELAAAAAGLRTEPDTAPPPGRSARRLARLKAVAWGVCGLIVTAFLTIVIVPSGTTLGTAVVTAGLTCAVFWPLAGITMLAVRHGWPHLPARHGPHDQVRFGAADHGVRQQRLGRFMG